jgi:hypothetical protein
MTLTRANRTAAAAALTLVAAVGCERDTTGLEPAPGNTDPIVFMDDFGAAVDYQAFLGSNLEAVSVDPNVKHEGFASLKISVPDPGDPAGGWAGGAFTTRFARELSGYNALTFWAKSSVASTLDIAGLGNDNTGFSKYEASWSNIPLTEDWTKYVIPIPLPEKLAVERGLFFLAEGPEGSTGHDVWFDDVMFETVGTISDPRPAMASKTINTFAGATIEIEGTQVVFNVDGTDQVIQHLPGYFNFESSNESVAMVVDGKIRVLDAGVATIKAKLDTLDALGGVTVFAVAPPPTAPTPPTLPAADVISLFSNAYRNVTVDTWSADWDVADVTDFQIAGDDVKAYSNFQFAGIEFGSQTINATEMTHFHIDVWVPDDGTVFRVKLVDFGANGIFGGGDDSEHEIAFTASSTPPLATETWLPLDIPLADFTRLMNREHLAQLILSGNPSKVYVDNIYFHK